MTEMIRKAAMSARIIMTSFRSSCFFIFGLIKSMVKVELDVNTKEESVDMDADNTNTTTSPINNSGSAYFNTAGIIASYSREPFGSVRIKVLPDSPCTVQNKRSNPPKK